MEERNESQLPSEAAASAEVGFLGRADTMAFLIPVDYKSGTGYWPQNPARDIAYNYPAIIDTAYNMLVKRQRWPSASSLFFEELGVTELELQGVCAAFHAFLADAADFEPCAETPNIGVAAKQSAERHGLVPGRPNSVPIEAYCAFQAALGQVILGYYFRGVADLTPHLRNASVMKLAEHGRLLTWFFGLSSFSRWLVRWLPTSVVLRWAGVRRVD